MNGDPYNYDGPRFAFWRAYKERVQASLCVHLQRATDAHVAASPFSAYMLQALEERWREGDRQAPATPQAGAVKATFDTAPAYLSNAKLGDAVMIYGLMWRAVINPTTGKKEFHRI